jgi:Putative DNA-binding domain
MSDYVDNGTNDLPSVEKLVASYPFLTYRFMAQYIDGTFQVARLIIGAPPASWSSHTYDTVLFRAGSKTGAVISTWLSKGEVTLHDQRYSLPSLQSPVSFQRCPSHTSYGLFTLSKPYTFYRIGFNNTVSQYGGVLAAEDAPFFLSQQEAEQSLLYDRDSTNLLTANVQLPNPEIALYLEQSEAWLESIHFSSSVLKITLGGTNLSEVKLKVTGTGVQDYDGYAGEEPLSLSAPDGPPDIVKIAVIKGNSWLDYFYDDKRSRYNPFVPRYTNVVFDYQEPGEEIVRLIESGEGRIIEFKGEGSDDKGKWAKTLVAFANTDGGHILFGVGDDGGVVGLEKELAKHECSLEKFRDSLTNTIVNMITPIPPYEILPTVKIEEKDVLAIKVTSDDQTHSLFFDKAHRFYIRRDATTRLANNFEVQELVRQKDMRKGVKPQSSILGPSSF